METEGSSPYSQQPATRAFLQYFVTCLIFYGEELLAPRPTPKLEDHLLSAVRDCLFNTFAATLHVWRPFLHSQSEDAPHRGDRDPLITVPCRCDRNPLITVPCRGDGPTSHGAMQWWQGPTYHCAVPCWQGFTYTVPCRGDRDPLITVPCHVDRNPLIRCHAVVTGTHLSRCHAVETDPLFTVLCRGDRDPLVTVTPEVNPAFYLFYTGGEAAGTWSWTIASL